MPAQATGQIPGFLKTFSQGQIGIFIQELIKKTREEKDFQDKLVYLYNLKNFFSYIKPDKIENLLISKTPHPALDFYQRELLSGFLIKYRETSTLRSLSGQFSLRDFKCQTLLPGFNEWRAWGKKKLSEIKKMISGTRDPDYHQGFCSPKNPFDFDPREIIGRSGLLLLSGELPPARDDRLLWIQSSSRYRIFINDKEIILPENYYDGGKSERGKYFIFRLPGDGNKVQVSALLKIEDESRFGIQFVDKKNFPAFTNCDPPEFSDSLAMSAGHGIQVCEPFKDSAKLPGNMLSKKNRALKNDWPNSRALEAWKATDLALWDNQFIKALDIFMPLIKKYFLSSGEKEIRIDKNLSLEASLNIYFLYQVLQSQSRASGLDAIGSQISKKISMSAKGLAGRYPFWANIAFQYFLKEKKIVTGLNFALGILKEHPNYFPLREELINFYLRKGFALKAGNHVRKLERSLSKNSYRMRLWNNRLKRYLAPWQGELPEIFLREESPEKIFHSMALLKKLNLPVSQDHLLKYLESNRDLLDGSFSGKIFFRLALCSNENYFRKCFDEKKEYYRKKARALLAFYEKIIQKRFPLNQNYWYWRSYADLVLTGKIESLKKWQQYFHTNVLERYLNFQMKKGGRTNAEILGLEIPMDFIANLIRSDHLSQWDSFREIDEDIFDLNSNGLVTHFHQELIKINNKKGREEFGEIKIPEDAGLIRAKTYSRGGKVSEATSIKKVGSYKYISMEGLGVGDVLHIAWLTKDKQSGIFDNKYIFQKVIPFWNLRVPTRKRKILLLHPGPMRVEKRLSKGWYAKRERLNVKYKEYIFNNKNVYEWELFHSDFKQNNSDMPFTIDLVPALYITNVSNYQLISTLAAKLSDSVKSDPLENYYLKKFLKDKIFSNYQAGRFPREDEIDLDLWKKDYASKGMARHIVNDLYKEINRNFGLLENYLFMFDSASTVFMRRRGTPEDKIVLMKAFLNILGIKSFLAYAKSGLKRTGTEAIIVKNFQKAFLYLPRQDGIAREAWYDFSNRYLRPGQITPSYHGARALLIPDKVGKEKEGQDPETYFTVHGKNIRNLKNSVFKLFIQSSGKVDFNISLTYKEIAGLVRGNLKNRENWDRVAYSVAGSFFPGSFLKNWQIENYEDYGKPLNINLSGFVSSYMFPIRNGIIGPIFPKKVQFILYYLGGNQRNFPLLILSEEKISDKFFYHLRTDGGKLFEPIYPRQLRNINIRTNFGYYKLTVREKKEILEIKRDFYLKPGWIDLPEYGEFRDFCIKIKNIEDKLIQFKIKKD